MQNMASTHPPGSKHVLIIEDQFLLSRQMSQELRARGFETVGPGANLTEAETLARDAPVDGAVVCSWSRDEMVFSAVRMLMERHVPFIYVSADDSHRPDWLPPVDSFGGDAPMADVIDRVATMLGMSRPAGNLRNGG